MTTVDEQTAGPPASEARAGLREWIGLGVLTLPVVLLALDLTVLHLAAPALGRDLGTSSTQLLWILDIYGFMIAGFLVTMGTLGDRIGRRKLLLIGAVAFAAASVIAAYAPTAEALIAARALLGIAGATLMPSTLGLIGNMFPDPRQRSLAIGVWMTAFIGGTAIGPIVGGIMLEHFWWGSVFLLGVPVMLLLLFTGPFLLSEYKAERAGRMDLTSAVLVIATMIPIIFGVKEIAKDGFTAVPMAAIVVGALFGALFIRRQRRLDDPLVDLELFRRGAFSAALVVLLLGITAMGGIMMLFVQFLQMVEGLSPMRTGLWLLPGVAASLVVALAAPMLARRVRPVALIAVGLGVAVVGLLMMSQVGAVGDVGLLVTGTVLMFLGITPLTVLGTDLVVGTAPKERASSAASLSETSGELGAALSIAIIGSVVTAVYTGRMASARFGGEVPEAARDNLAAALASAEELPAATAAGLVAAGRDAFTAALNYGALASAGLLVVAGVIAAFGLRKVAPIGQSDSE